MIVVVLPGGQNGSRVLERCEFGDVQAFITESAVKGLDEPVFRGLARSNEIELHAALPGPLIEHARREFSSVIDGNGLGQGTPLRHLVGTPS